MRATAYPIRFPLRTVPQDRLALEIARRTARHSSDSDVFRAAIETLVRLWALKMDGCRIVLRNDELQRQHELSLEDVSTSEAGEGPVVDRTSEGKSTVEVRLSDAQNTALDDLVAAGVGMNRSHVVRRALSIYSHLANRSLEGWRITALSREGSVVSIPLLGIAPVFDYGATAESARQVCEGKSVPEQSLAAIDSVHESTRLDFLEGVAPESLIQALVRVAEQETCDVRTLIVDMLRDQVSLRLVGTCGFYAPFARGSFACMQDIAECLRHMSDATQVRDRGAIE